VKQILSQLFKLEHTVIRTSFFIAVIILAGCAEGVKTFPTTGKVVYKADGKPFQGLIYFEAVTPPHSRSMAQTNVDGTFSLSTVKEGGGAVEGEQVVRIDVDQTDEVQIKDKAKNIHPKYLDFATSPLKVKVEAGKANNFTIELDRPGQK
jgi:hypothetical protein